MMFSAAGPALLPAPPRPRDPFINGMQHLADEGVGESEQHGDTNTDQECSVDQTSQQEHLGLQCIHELRLTSGGFKILSTHESDTDTCTDSTETNNKTASESNESNVGH